MQVFFQYQYVKRINNNFVILKKEEVPQMQIIYLLKVRFLIYFPDAL
jgi:hypothetical protein